MPTPKPGQIRCPTCHRPTPLAAFCTQCGAAIPASAQPRPRGMDRDELDERMRTRRPGEGALRRGTPLEEDIHHERANGYVPFVPQPEDSMALREEEDVEPAPNVDNTAPDFDRQRPAPPEPIARPPEPLARPAAPAAYDEQAHQGTYRPEPESEEPYGAPEDAYPYPYYAADDGRRRGPSVLPILGFIALCVLALGVGAVLASVLGGPGGSAQATPTPSAEQTVAASVEQTALPSEAPTDGASATPEPTDGPITFPDGAVIRVEPCASQEMTFDGCVEDGSVITARTMWVWIGFDDAQAADTFTLDLRNDGQTIDQQVKVLGEVLNCQRNGQPICSGYLVGAAYRDLEPGEYELVIRRDDDFADAATFTVEG